MEDRDRNNIDPLDEDGLRSAFDKEFGSCKFLPKETWIAYEVPTSFALLFIGTLLFAVFSHLGTTGIAFGSFAFVALSAAGVLAIYSRRYRVFLNGGWPLDKLEKQCLGLASDWESVFQNAQVDQVRIHVWGTLKPRFFFGLAYGTIANPGNPEDHLEGFFVAHYDVLRRANNKKLKDWQALSLFFQGDLASAGSKLSELNNEIAEAILETNPVSIYRCVDPISCKPLSHVWSAPLAGSKPVVL